MLWRGATRGAWIYRGLFDFRLDLLFAPHPVHPCFLIYSRFTVLVAEVSARPPDSCTHQKIATHGGGGAVSFMSRYGGWSDMERTLRPATLTGVRRGHHGYTPS
jgi:hypothetical protein